MKICYLADATSIHVQRWAEWFARRGHEVHVLSLLDRPIPSVRVHPLKYAGRSILWLPLKVVEIRRYLSQVDPEVLHAHRTESYGLWGALAGRHPFVVSAWGSDVLVLPANSRLQSRILRYVLRRADWCIPVAEHLRATMRSYGLRDDRSEAIPMGVEFDKYPRVPYRQGTRSPSFVSTRGFRAVYDVGTVVRAAPSMFASRPDLRGTILGDGPEEPRLRALAAETGVADRLRFEGAVDPDQVMATLARSRVYVSTSKSDGASVSLMEAMSQGCLPVVTDIPANREWLTDGENGYLFPVGDASALARLVLKAVDDEPFLESASRRNIALVEDRGDLAKNLGRVESVYTRLLAGRSG